MEQNCKQGLLVWVARVPRWPSACSRPASRSPSGPGALKPSHLSRHQRRYRRRHACVPRRRPAIMSASASLMMPASLKSAASSSQRCAQAACSPSIPPSCRKPARALAERCAAAGILLVDAPVSGGTQVAAAGKLTVMCGATEAAFAQAKPVFESFGTTIVRLGPPGAGQRAKNHQTTRCSPPIWASPTPPWPPPTPWASTARRSPISSRSAAAAVLVLKIYARLPNPRRLHHRRAPPGQRRQPPRCHPPRPPGRRLPAQRRRRFSGRSGPGWSKSLSLDSRRTSQESASFSEEKESKKTFLIWAFGVRSSQLRSNKSFLRRFFSKSGCFLAGCHHGNHQHERAIPRSGIAKEIQRCRHKP